jgi:hypothetical protein
VSKDFKLFQSISKHFKGKIYPRISMNTVPHDTALDTGLPPGDLPPVKAARWLTGKIPSLPKAQPADLAARRLNASDCNPRVLPDGSLANYLAHGPFTNVNDGGTFTNSA